MDDETETIHANDNNAMEDMHTDDNAMVGTQDSKRKVFVHVNFLKVYDIETIKEEFKADIIVETRWREPELDNNKDTMVTDYSPYWNPKIALTNIENTISHKTWTAFRRDKGGLAWIVERHRIKGVFGENLELQEFPFDVQDLSIVVSSELYDDAVDIVEDDQEISSINVVCFVDETEWTMCDLVYAEPRTFNKALQEVQFRNPALLVKAVAKRKAGFFMYNIILIMTMITCLGFTTFSVDQQLTQNRLQLTFIITLTGVTFLMVTNQSLPKIPYLTHMDRFIIGSMIFNFLVCMWHAVLSLYKEKDYVEDLDFWAFIILLVMYILFNVIFYLITIYNRVRRSYQIDELKAAYQKKALKIMGSAWGNDRSANRKAWTKRNKIDAQGDFTI